MSDVFLFYKLSTCSKRAMLRIRGRFGRIYDYQPRGRLLTRLSDETGLTIEQVYHQLLAERRELLQSFGREAEL